MFCSTAEMVNPRHTALVIVDMQNDYCAPGGLCDRVGRDIGAGQAIIPPLGMLLTGARQAGALIVYARMTTLPDGRSDSPAWSQRREQGTLRQICLEGTWGHEVVDGLRPQPGDLVIDKLRYSAFLGTGLTERLREAGRQTLVFTGVATNTCVESSLRDAFQHDFFCVLAEDATAGFHADLHAATLKNVRNRFGHVMSVAEILTSWTGSTTAQATL